MDKLLAGMLLIPVALAIFAGVSLLLALPVMWLWNMLMPEIFGLHTITYFQAVGLMCLSGLLLGKTSSSCSSK